VAGVSGIRMISKDIQLARKAVIKARANTKTLINGFESYVKKLGILRVRKARLQKLEDLLNVNFKTCVHQYKTITMRMKKLQYNEAYKELLKLKEALKQIIDSSRKKKSSLLIAEQLEKKVSSLEIEIKQGIKRSLLKVICQFSIREYADICKYYETYNERLPEDIKDQYIIIVEKNVNQLLMKHAKGEIGEYQDIASLCLKVNVHELVDILNELFKFHASLLQSYCSIILFHEDTKSNEQKSQPKKALINKPTTSFHQTTKRLFENDKESIWNLMQKKLGKILDCLETKIVELSIPELFEVLVICSRYFSLGKEFSGSSTSKYKFFFNYRVKNLILKKLCRRYINEFHISQIKKLKSIMEIDLWKRLPLPDNYEYSLFTRYRLPELRNFMLEYPPNIKSLLSEISSEDSKPQHTTKPREVLSQLSVNPFTVECRLITTQTIAKPQSFKKITVDDDELNLDEIEPDESPITVSKSIEFYHKSFKLKNQVICSPGLNLIKSLIKYVELMHIIRPCKELILKYFMEIYKYYIYCLFIVFTPGEFKIILIPSGTMNLERAFSVLRAQAKYTKLAKYLKKIKESLQKESTPIEELLPTSINDMVKLGDSKTLNGACEKIVAIESSYYIFEALQKIKGKIEVRNR